MEPLVRVEGVSKFYPRVHRPGERLRAFAAVLAGKPAGEAVYGDGYRELLFHCRAYVHATEVGGTHPALVEAMGAGRPVLYYDTPENREVAGDVGLRFRFTGDASLEAVIAEVIDEVDEDQATYLIKLLDSEKTSDVLTELDEDIREAILKNLSSKEIAGELEEWDTDHATEIV